MIALLLAALVVGPPQSADAPGSKAPRVFVAAYQTPLYARPSADAGVVTALHFGAEVKVLRSADRWYRVATEGKGGYLPEDAFTPTRFEEDFDGDKEKELATVARIGPHTVRVRFFEPQLKTEAAIDLEIAEGARVELAKNRKLLHVTQPEQWVRYRDGAAQVLDGGAP
jgi:hypothetical protein